LKKERRRKNITSMNLLCMKQPQVVNVELTNNMQLQVIFETVETN